MKPAETLCCFAPIATAFGLAGDGALQSLELLETRAQMAGIGLACAIGEGGERLDAQIHPHHWSPIHWRDMLLFNQDGDIPASPALAHGGGADRGRGGQI